MKKTIQHLPATVDSDGLTMRQALFARAYVIRKGHQVNAARDAGYKAGGKQIRLLLANPKVIVVIQRERARLMEKAQLTAEMVISELKKIAFLDPRSCFDADGNVLPIPQWNDDCAAAIAGFSIRKDHTPRLRFSSKLEALKLLGHHLGLWEFKDVSNDRLREVIEAFREGPVERKDTIQ